MYDVAFPHTIEGREGERERKEMGFIFMSATKEAKRKCVCVKLREEKKERKKLEFLLDEKHA
jgi:hypothetical protein